MSTPQQIPFKQIQSITNNFSDENFIGSGLFGNIFEGRLSQSGESIDVAVRSLDYSFYLQEIAFDKEISVLSSLKHENMVSMVGFCYENNEMFIVNKREARGSLNRHLSGTKLNYMQRLKICVGVASALSYLHNASVIHHNVNSTSILLDEKWEAKLSGFEYSMRIPSGDLDLAYEKLGIGSYKSDLFSFGIVLFEILGVAEAFTSKDDGSFQTPVAIFHHENRKLHEFVDPDLFSQMDPQSFNIISETACYCLRKQQAPPYMNQVLERLEKALKLQQKRENPERSAVSVERQLSLRWKLMLKNLEHMRVQLNDIVSATEKFAKTCCIASGGFGTVYKAELEHVDREYCCAIEGKGERELPKRRSEVAIKRIFNTEDESGEQGFYGEIDLLTKCKHSNIVTLLGFCDEGSDMILIYEYATNGSLADYLQNKSNITNNIWLRRIKICLDVANGLWRLHSGRGNLQEIVHRDIKSDNILLGENFEAKIGDFGLSKFLSAYKEHSGVVGTRVYIDPQYVQEARLKKEIDVYSFGVVLCEVLFGTLAYDPIYTTKNNKGLALLAQQHFRDGTVNEIIDPKIKEEITKTSFISIKGPNKYSVDTFSKIAYRCLDGRQDNRPTIGEVLVELKKASFFQETDLEHLKIQLVDIMLATDDFHETCCMGKGQYGWWYKAQLDYFDSESPLEIERKNTKDELSRKCGTVAIRRMHKTVDAQIFLSEIEMLTRCKHPNIVSLLGFCDESLQRILVYEYASNGSLDDYLRNTDKRTIFRWVECIKICLDIAKGLNYLHSTAEEKQMIIHCEMKSANVLLGKNWEAKIADFGLSRILHGNQQGSTLNTNNIAGTDMYLDPEYAKTGELKKESDIYSFGVVMFEILSGKLAYDESYNVGSDKGLPSTVRHFFNKGILKEIVDPRLWEETGSDNFTLNRGPNQDSLDAFLKIAYQCLDETQAKRPTIEVVIKELEKALYFQEKSKDNLKISLVDIKLATRNFSDANLIGSGGLGKVYMGEVTDANGCRSIIAAKRLMWEYDQGEAEFWKELKILKDYKHENVIGLVGYCRDMGERVIVYEYAPRGSLDRLLHSSDLTWTKRLEICIDVGSGLEFFHGGAVTQEVVIHRDIKSSNILLTVDWKAKVSGFELTLINPINQDTDYVIDEVMGTPAYCDPLYKKNGFLTKESDIYSFGVVFLEIMSGRLISEKIDGRLQDLTPVLKRHYEEGTFDEMVFAGIKEHIVPNSLTTFLRIAYQCVHDKREERPTAHEVVVQLKIALDFQRDYELWEPKLPKDYKEIIQMSNSPQLYSTEKKEDLYNMFSNGILLQQEKVLLSLEGHGERNELISATKFSYRNRSPHKWRSLTESRFHKVAEMLDISNLMIRIKTKAQFLFPNVVYGVHLVFKFCDSRDFPSKPMYVNLSYRKGNETLHAYFATRRDNKWMMIELYRFLNKKEDEVFKFLIESLSTYYCGDDAIHVEGIEFRAIKKVEHEEIEKVKEVHQVLNSNLNVDQVQQILPTESEKLFSLSEVNEKKHLMLSAKAALNNFSDLKLYKSKSSTESRFQEVIELLPQRVFRIHCKINSQILSPDTEYVCYLVFNLSEECQGLQCPVEVRDLLNREKKESEIIYFVSPNPWNILDITRVREQRKDGWMEVNVWKFNSNQEDKNGCIAMDLNLISYEGTLSGLIICGLEFRPM